MFSLVFAAFLVDCLIVYYAWSDLAENAALLEESSRVSAQLDDVHILLEDAESAQRGFLITRDPAYLAPYQRAVPQLRNALADLQEMTHDDAEGARVARLIELAEFRLLELAATLALADQEDFASAMRLVREDGGEQIMADVNRLAEELSVLRDAEVARLRDNSRVGRARLVLAFAVSMLISLALLCALYLSARRDIARRQEISRLLESTNESLERTVAERTRELALINQELDRSNQELGQFAYVASHDLQEPLRKIQAFGDRLVSRYGDELAPGAQDYLSRMVAAARRMSKLLADLLEFSRVGMRPQAFGRVDLTLVVEQVVSDLEVLIEREDARLSIGPLPVIEADETQMRQLFQNLLANSIKFHRPEVPPEVRIEHREIEVDGTARHQLCVTDNGIGLDPQYAERVFEPFQRLHQRGDYEGTGIGLAICRRICQRHGGQIFVRPSPEPPGAQFTVIFPMRVDPAADLPGAGVDGPEDANLERTA